MTYSLSKRSKKKLEGVHPSLVSVVERAIELTEQDFSVLLGVRTAAEQNALYQKGRTKPGKIVTYRDGYVKASNHQTKKDGYGHAVDLVPYPLDWNDWSKYEAIRDAMFKAAEELDVNIIWGGSWKMRDGPHFEVVNV